MKDVFTFEGCHVAEVGSIRDRFGTLLRSTAVDDLGRLINRC